MIAKNMPKKISPTYQQKLFNDDQLGLPDHDKIVRWVDQNIRTNPLLILRALGIETGEASVESVWSRQRSYSYSHDDVFSSAIDAIASLGKPELPGPPPLKIFSVVWEPLVKNDRGTIMGAMDLRATIGMPTPRLDYDIKKVEIAKEKRRLLYESEISTWKPYYGRGVYIWEPKKNAEKILFDFGLSDELKNLPFVFKSDSLHFVSNVRWEFDGGDYDYDRIDLVVEAKTEIRSAGELMRQMNFYRDHLSRGTKCLVVAPAHAWRGDTKSILNEQRIHTLNYMSNG